VPVIVPLVIRPEALELAIIENVQRSDLNAMKRQRLCELVERFGYTQRGTRPNHRKAAHLANTMRLLKLLTVCRRSCEPFAKSGTRGPLLPRRRGDGRQEIVKKG